MNSLIWHYKRLKTIPLSEFPYRFSQELKKRIDRSFSHPKETIFPNDITINKSIIIEYFCIFPDNLHHVKKLSEKIILHRFEIFGIQKDFGNPIDWHCDPCTGKSWPLTFWGAIDHRNGRSIGGIKFAWELNRFHHFPRLAIAFSLLNDPIYKDEIFSQLSSWIEANPYPKGVNWISGIELGIRIINIIYTLKFLGNTELNPEQKNIILYLIQTHARHLYRYPSKYSSCGNHAIAEALGMFAAGLCFPELKNAKKWKECGKKVLEREVTRQIYPDGSSFEHTIPYLQFVLDHFIIYYLLCKEYNEPCSRDIENRLRSSFNFISNILDENENLPYIGDEDNGYLMKLWFGKHNNFVSLLNTGAVLFDNQDLLTENSAYDEKTFFLLGSKSQQKWNTLKEQKTPNTAKSKYFSDAGLAVIRDNNPALLFVGNSGPLGAKPLAGHGHADALSFWLSVDGNPVFIDPGTYLYHSGGKWRTYFRSTAAHNTIAVDGFDQARIASDFMFNTFYNIIDPSFEEGEETVCWKACHDGYKTLKDPVIHKREVIYNKSDKCFEIKDYVECKKSHRVECFFHLHPAFRITQNGNSFEIISDNSGLTLNIDEKWDQKSILFGQDNPLTGWYSPCFNKLHETYMLLLSANINKTEVFKSIIQLN